MGTNFFWTPEVAEELGLTPSEDASGLHLGKRSAAGLYCWDCRRTLCVEGEARIHYHRVRWYRVCPQCGKAAELCESIPFSTALELGFADARVERPTGASTCSSFSWAADPATVRRVCGERGNEQIVRDEYGDLFTGRQFLFMLESNCPIEYTENIGRWFR